ncbi:class I SAM-dependent methyltransferase [Thermodesulfobacteriota bacterium]
MDVDYTEISESYDKHRSYSRDLIEAVIEFGPIKKGMKALELGCGTGNAIIGLKEILNIDAFGVDNSRRMLRRARKKDLNVICSDIDSQPLPFCDGCFHIVLLVYVIHQIGDLPYLLEEIARVLGDDGALLVLTSSHEQIEQYHPIVGQFFPRAVDIEKARFQDIAVLCNLLESKGFRTIKKMETLVERTKLDREYLKKVKDRYVSTFHLMSVKEFEIGVTRLEEFIEKKSQLEPVEWRGTLVCARKNNSC